MPDKQTPTDAELKALLLDKLPASKHYIRPVIEKMVAAMQAAIDKWGQPAQAWEPLTDERIEDLLICGNPTDEEKRLIRMGWDAAHGIKGGQHGTE